MVEWKINEWKWDIIRLTCYGFEKNNFNGFIVLLLKYLKLKEEKSDSYLELLFTNLDQTEL
jgi:hypothetical protein